MEGIEVNSGPVISFVLTFDAAYHANCQAKHESGWVLVMIHICMCWLHVCHQWSEVLVFADLDSKSVVVLMSNNPSESKLRHADLTELLDSRYVS